MDDPLYDPDFDELPHLKPHRRGIVKGVAPPRPEPSPNRPPPPRRPRARGSGLWSAVGTPEGTEAIDGFHWRVLCALHVLSTSLTLMGIDLYVASANTPDDGSTQELYFLGPAAAGLATLPVMTSLVGWRRSYAFVGVAAFWAGFVHFPLVLVGCNALDGARLIPRGLAPDVVACSFFTSVSVIIVSAPSLTRAEHALKPAGRRT